MFYRLKFDGTVGKILNTAGFVTSSERFSVWPAGLSAQYISEAKVRKIDAKSAAYFGVLTYFSDEAMDMELRVRVLNALMEEHATEKALDAVVSSALMKANADLMSS